MGKARWLVASIALGLLMPSAAHAQPSARRNVEVGGGVGSVLSWWTSPLIGGDVRVTVPMAARGDVEFLAAAGPTPEISTDLVGLRRPVPPAVPRAAREWPPAIHDVRRDRPRVSFSSLRNRRVAAVDHIDRWRHGKARAAASHRTGRSAIDHGARHSGQRSRRDRRVDPIGSTR